MSVYVKVLIPTKTASVAFTTEYASVNVTTIIDKFTATNYGAIAASITVALVNSGDAPAAFNSIVRNRTLQPNECYTFPELVGAALSSGQYISVSVPAGTVNIRASGREIT